MPTITKEVEIEINNEDYCADLDDREMMDLIEHCWSNLQNEGDTQVFTRLCRGMCDNSLQELVDVARNEMTEKGQRMSIISTMEVMSEGQDESWWLKTLKDTIDMHMEADGEIALFEFLMERIEKRKKAA